jgi:hypothetical protein
MDRWSRHATRSLALVLGLALVALLLGAALHAPGPAAAQGSGAPSAPVAPHARVLTHTPSMRLADLAGRPDTDQVEFGGGRRVSVGALRRLATAAPKLRAPGSYRPPAALRTGPAGSGTRVDTAADLTAALKRADRETVRLPSGRLATVGQIKFVLPKVPGQLARPSLASPAIKVGRGATASDWKGILHKPDSTVLESPNGTRITVGELKQALAGSGKNPPPATGRPGDRGRR